MGLFVRINNADRFPGLVLRVKGTGDEIEIGYESLEEKGRNVSSGQAVPAGTEQTNATKAVDL